MFAKPLCVFMQRSMLIKSRIQTLPIKQHVTIWRPIWDSKEWAAKSWRHPSEQEWEFRVLGVPTKISGLQTSSGSWECSESALKNVVQIKGERHTREHSRVMEVIRTSSYYLTLQWVMVEWGRNESDRRSCKSSVNFKEERT